MGYLAAGMIVFWLTTFVFVLSVVRRQRSLEEELRVLRDTVDEDSPA
ncbi:MAG: CcmD family protein [Anaerolineae bacterium]|jgi:CcmD family protein